MAATDTRRSIPGSSVTMPWRQARGCEVRVFTVMPGADVDPTADVGAGTIIWHLAQVRERAQLGEECVIGRGAYIGAGVHVGNAVKIQNYALVYEPAALEDGVFIGPATVLTNDLYPRSITPEGRLKRGSDWEAQGVVIRHGASVGARVVVVPGITIGRWAMVAAGAVVTRDVPDYALVRGTPARRVGWVGRAGFPLRPNGSGKWICPATEMSYAEHDGQLEEAFA